MKKKRAMTDRIQCNPHPNAPHSFMRDASHSADRYVCECEGWQPADDAGAACRVIEAKLFEKKSMTYTLLQQVFKAILDAERKLTKEGSASSASYRRMTPGVFGL